MSLIVTLHLPCSLGWGYRKQTLPLPGGAYSLGETVTDTSSSFPTFVEPLSQVQGNFGLSLAKAGHLFSQHPLHPGHSHVTQTPPIRQQFRQEHRRYWQTTRESHSREVVCLSGQQGLWYSVKFSLYSWLHSLQADSGLPGDSGKYLISFNKVSFYLNV